MVKLYDGGVYVVNGAEIVPEAESEKVKALTGKAADKAEAKKGTMAYNIIKAHNQSDDMEQLRLKFDSMTSHDITYVGIIQTARASGMTEFPLPYVLTNCHNSLCAGSPSPPHTSTAASTYPPTWRTSTPTTARPCPAAGA